MFKVKIYTKLYVFGVKKTVWISFFFLPLLPPRTCFMGLPLPGVCVCMCIRVYTHETTHLYLQVYVHFIPALLVPSIFSLTYMEAFDSFGNFSFRSRKSLKRGRKILGHPSKFHHSTRLFGLNMWSVTILYLSLQLLVLNITT